MTTAAASAAILLGSDQAQAEGIGFLVVVLLGVATWLLLRSLNRQLKKVPKTFDPPGEYGDEPSNRSPRGG